VTQARAKVVRDYLVQHFKFDDTRMKISVWASPPKLAKPARRGPHILLKFRGTKRRELSFGGAHLSPSPRIEQASFRR